MEREKTLFHIFKYYAMNYGCRKLTQTTVLTAKFQKNSKMSIYGIPIEFNRTNVDVVITSVLAPDNYPCQLTH